MKNNTLKGISRIHSRGIGWLVRLYRNNKVTSKLFSDNKFGGADQSLLAAKEYYRQLQTENPAKPKPPFRITPLRNNTSGHNGICETFTRTKKGGKIPCWTVSWYNPPKKLRSKSFYFHDEQERRQTLKLALKFRKQRETEILKQSKPNKKLNR